MKSKTSSYCFLLVLTYLSSSPLSATEESRPFAIAVDFSYLIFHKNDISRPELPGIGRTRGLVAFSPFVSLALSKNISMELKFDRYLSRREGKGPYRCDFLLIIPVCGSPLYSEQEVTIKNTLILLNWRKKINDNLYLGLSGGGGISRYQSKIHDYTTDPETLLHFDSRGKLAQFETYLSLKPEKARFDLRASGGFVFTQYDNQAIRADGFKLAIQIGYAIGR